MLKFILPFLFCFSLIKGQTTKFEDNMNGDNSIAGLEARGWLLINADGGGVSNAWFPGNPDVFPAAEGTGYIAANYQGANNNGEIDQWLISPPIDYVNGDVLYFYLRSPEGNFNDKVGVYYSQNASTSLNDFDEIGVLTAPKTGWELFFAFFPYTGDIRIAFRYFMQDSATANYVGLDNIKVVSAININKTFTFGDVSKTENYRMIGLPGDINTSSAQFFTGTQKQDWNIYYDNGNETNYLVEFNNTDNFNFKPGNGFWIISRNPVNISGLADAVILSLNNSYTINLHNGWNIISNPFDKPVNWTDVINLNGLAANQIIYSYEGSWLSNVTSFEPYKGYYFNNVNNLPSLNIPYTPTVGKIIPDLTNDEDKITINLRNNDKIFSSVSFSFNEKASNDFDELDYFAPPGDFDEARIVIYNDNLKVKYKYLMKESRNEIGEGQIYNLEIFNKKNENLILEISGLDFIKDNLAYLIENNTLIKYDLKKDRVIISPSETKRNFTLLVGNQDFINNNQNSFLPDKLELLQNFPNPFNPSTKIYFNNPEHNHIKVIVYNMLGEAVKILTDQMYAPGNYSVEWDGKNDGGNLVASGVYFYCLETASRRLTNKMILSK